MPQRVSIGAPDSSSEGPSLWPRLLDVPGAARYLSVSPWTVKGLLASGTLRRVVIPLPGGRDLRRTLVDRLELDDLAARWRT